jgi:hypothetical protein
MSNETDAKPLMVFYEPESVGIFLKVVIVTFIKPLFTNRFSDSKGVF